MTDDFKVCPAPGCDFATCDTSELAAHVNAEHSGEYMRSDWPDLGDV